GESRRLRSRTGWQTRPAIPAGPDPKPRGHLPGVEFAPMAREIARMVGLAAGTPGIAHENDFAHRYLQRTQMSWARRKSASGAHRESDRRAGCGRHSVARDLARPSTSTRLLAEVLLLLGRK